MPTHHLSPQATISTLAHTQGQLQYGICSFVPRRRLLYLNTSKFSKWQRAVSVLILLSSGCEGIHPQRMGDIRMKTWRDSVEQTAGCRPPSVGWLSPPSLPICLGTGRRRLTSLSGLEHVVLLQYAFSSNNAWPLQTELALLGCCRGIYLLSNLIPITNSWVKDSAAGETCHRD